MSTYHWVLTNCVPENHFEEFVYRQITCSPGVCEVNVHLPSLLYTFDKMILSSGSRISTCIPISGLDGANPFVRGS